MRITREVSVQELILSGHAGTWWPLGVAWRDPARQRVTLAPIPVNYLVAWFRWLVVRWREGPRATWAGRDLRAEGWAAGIRRGRYEALARAVAQARRHRGTHSCGLLGCRETIVADLEAQALEAAHDTMVGSGGI